MKERQRSFWGWGYADADVSEAVVQRFKAMARFSLGLKELSEVEPPRLQDLELRPSRFSLPPELAPFCTNAVLDRAGHSYGKSYRDLVRGLKGQFDNPPDYVAYPRTEDDILALMHFCQAEEMALVPYGGGTSVVGGVEPTRSPRYRGVVTADLKHFNRILEVDSVSRCARIQAGIYGPALEAGLKPHGLTLRHFPQSFEFSTVGGWIATRAGGHFATLYTHIDDFVESIRIVTPEGVLETRRLPGSGAGPDPNRLLLGSEGTLGIITEAWLRLQTSPRFRATATVLFAEAADGVEAVRALGQSGLHPANCRLISAVEALSAGIGNGADTVLLLGFESHDHALDPWLDRALAICAGFNGRRQVDEVDDRGKDDASTSQQWKKAFLQAPYLRDRLVASGLILETFETAVTWDQFEALHRAVLDETQQAIVAHCDQGFVTWRFTHVYPDGPAPYYTVIAVAEPGREIAQWEAIKTAASQAILQYGGTITHHHAVGKDHRAWYRQERDPLFGAVLAHTKETLDPHWILNPGVLLADQDGIEEG